MLLRFLPIPALLAAALLQCPAHGQVPPVPVPAQNPLTPAKIVLGKILFWDEQLSSDNSMACGTCHVPEFGGTDPRLSLATSIHPGPDGVFGTADDIHGSPGVARQDASGDFTPVWPFGLHKQTTARLANTTLGAAYHDNLFWDSRASTQFTDPETNQILMPYGGALESQAIAPILSPGEMATEGRTWQDVRTKLQNAQPLALARSLTPDILAALLQNPSYPLLFTAAFGDPYISAQRIAYAIASYERTQVPDDTPWDRFMAGQTSAMTATEQAGWALFQGSGRCIACHIDPLFQDDQSHVLGLRPEHEDLGLGAISMVPIENGAFKTPTLRNAGLRPRLFHNGQSPGLGDPQQATDPNSAQNIYLNGGGVDRSNLDPFLLVLNHQGVTPADMQTMLEFVRTALTDARCAQGLPPFDHPTLRSMVAPPPLAFGPSLAGTVEPFFVDTVPTFIGNAAWKLGLAGGDGSTLAYLGYGLQAATPGITIAGLPWNVDTLGGQFVALIGNPGEPGHQTWRLPIPNDGNLANVDVFFQLFALDALAPTGVAASRGERLTIQ